MLQRNDRLLEVRISLEMNPISRRHKIRMNRIFREIVKTNRIPYPEADSFYERLRSRCISFWGKRHK